MGIEAQYYDNHAGNALEQVNNPKEIERAQKTVDHLPPSIHSLLDVGCGCGLTLHTIQTARPELKLVGLERSQKTADEARTIFGLNVVDGSADNLPFEDNAFDVVMANELLEHLPWGVYQKNLTELSRVISSCSAFHHCHHTL
jgi:ubiquinone/menaquinone biosynthesis C-methylase UbiE